MSCLRHLQIKLICLCYKDDKPIGFVPGKARRAATFVDNHAILGLKRRRHGTSQHMNNAVNCLTSKKSARTCVICQKSAF